MDQPRPPGGPPRRLLVDARRARWAAALAAVGTAGLWSTAHASTDVPVVAGSSCVVQDVGWELRERTVDVGASRASPPVAGVSFSRVPPGCTGRRVEVTYTDAAGRTVASSTLLLWPGARSDVRALPGPVVAVAARWVLVPG